MPRDECGRRPAARRSDDTAAPPAKSSKAARPAPRLATPPAASQGQVRRARLEFRQGNSDEVYEIDLEPSGSLFVVNFRYGRRGGVLRRGTRTPSPVTRTEADTLFDDLVD